MRNVAALAGRLPPWWSIESWCRFHGRLSAHPDQFASWLQLFNWNQSATQNGRFC
jgi:hypothetical protein